MTGTRDHGGGLDAAVETYGGARAEWLDLSTGINPVPYPIGEIPANCWTALPDRDAYRDLNDAARRFWKVPPGAAIVAANGASALIARMPEILPHGRVLISGPTYNEHAAAFRLAGREVIESGTAPIRVLVHPNNPDGRLWSSADLAGNVVIDESFCDVTPDQSLVAHASGSGGPIVLKSFGKFWGLAGLRLGLMIADHATAARMTDLLGPWAVSGPALAIGTRALSDLGWAKETRRRLSDDAARLDRIMAARGARHAGGTDLFRLYEVDDAARWQDRLARGRVWSRIFPYSRTWLRLGLPQPGRWDQIEAAL